MIINKEASEVFPLLQVKINDKEICNEKQQPNLMS